MRIELNRRSQINPGGINVRGVSGPPNSSATCRTLAAQQMEDLLQSVRHSFQLAFAKRAAPTKDPLRWGACHRLADRP